MGPEHRRTISYRKVTLSMAVRLVKSVPSPIGGPREADPAVLAAPDRMIDGLDFHRFL